VRRGKDPSTETDHAGLSTSLRDAVARVKDSLDLGEVLALTVEQMGVAAGVDRCYIRMIEPGSTALGPIEYEWSELGTTPLAAEPDVQFPMASLAATTRTSQWSDDVTRDDRAGDPSMLGHPLNLLEHDARAVLATPLAWGVEILGVITFHSRTPRHWSAGDVSMIELAAREVSSAVHHALLYEDALEQIRKLQELEERRAEYISMISHEIRSPMTVVAGIADVLQKKRDRLSEESLGDLINSLGREARRLARLVSEILDVERIDRGGMLLTREPLDATDLVHEAVEDTGEAGRIKVDTEVDAAPIDADRDKIKQVLINLLSNAAKFGPEDSPITVTLVQNDGAIVIGVRDEGPGMTTEEKSRLFQRFSRLESTAGKPGTGLGLYLSRLIVERHAGRIWVDSSPGEGTCFRFSLPITE
jgi:signal transduction histidine kinase